MRTTAGKLIDELEFIRSFNKPYAIWHAEKDALVNLEYVQKAKPLRPWKYGVQVVPGCGPMLQVEAATDLNRDLVEFVNEVGRP